MFLTFPDLITVAQLMAYGRRGGIAMKRALVLGALMMSMVLFGAASADAATEVQRFEVKGQNASAYFSSVDGTGCIVTYAGVFAGDQVTQSKPQPSTTSSSVYVFLDIVDTCTWTYLTSAYGYAELAPDQFVVDKKLSSADLAAAVELYDYVTGASFTVDVDLHWTATGSPTQTGSRSFYRSPGFSVKYNSKGAFAPASATGTILEGSTNYAANPSDYADLSDAQSGEMVKTKY
jgi:hypothetical protein